MKEAQPDHTESGTPPEWLLGSRGQWGAPENLKQAMPASDFCFRPVSLVLNKSYHKPDTGDSLNYPPNPAK